MTAFLLAPPDAPGMSPSSPDVNRPPLADRRALRSSLYDFAASEDLAGRHDHALDAAGIAAALAPPPGTKTALTAGRLALFADVLEARGKRAMAEAVRQVAGDLEGLSAPPCGAASRAAGPVGPSASGGTHTSGGRVIEPGADALAAPVRWDAG